MPCLKGKLIFNFKRFINLDVFFVTPHDIDFCLFFTGQDCASLLSCNFYKGFFVLITINMNFNSEVTYMLIICAFT